MSALLTDNVLKRGRFAAADEMRVEGHHHETTVLSLHKFQIAEIDFVYVVQAAVILRGLGDCAHFKSMSITLVACLLILPRSAPSLTYRADKALQIEDF